MTFADTLTVVLQDDTRAEFQQVRYGMTRDGLQVVDAAGQVRRFKTFDVADVQAARQHRPGIAQ